MSISEHPCGQLADRREAKLFTLRNSKELTVKLTSFGGIITELHVPDHAGNFDDIVLECKGVEPDTTEHSYFGANIGRVADRITQAQFERDQKIYRLPDNHKNNSLYGDEHELDSQLWDTHCPEIQGKSFIEFSLTDPDGSHGFPGNRQCNVRDSLSDAIELRIESRVQFLASHRSHAADNGTLTDTMVAVEVELNNFRDSIELRSQSILDNRNTDTHYFLPAARTTEPMAAAKIVAPTSERMMEVWTTVPILQFYAALRLDASFRNQNKHEAIYPDAVNRPYLRGTLLRPAQIFESNTSFRFFTKEAMDARH